MQRVIVNSKQWQQPTQGRLGRLGEGRYVQVNGFGHEDWNFNKGFEIDGSIHGYAYYEPSEDKMDNLFNFAFAVYEEGAWHVVGFYLNASYDINGIPDNKRILKAKAEHLLKLGDSLGKGWRQMPVNDIANKLQVDNQNIRWKVKTSNIKPLAYPVKIPKNIINIKNRRLTAPTELSESLFNKLINFASKGRPKQGSDEEVLFPEGKKIQIIHSVRERNQKAVALAKKSYLSKHGKYKCQVCGFDFVEKYGQIGADFIEAHHTVPVSELRAGSKTSPKDIALVCSNCHRMLHRRRPWLKMKDLKRLLSNRT